MDRRKFHPSSLDDLRQSDELGILARVFQDMAVEVRRAKNIWKRGEGQDCLQQKTCCWRNRNAASSRTRCRACFRRRSCCRRCRTIRPIPARRPWSGRELGGDFYDFFMINERDLGIVIADVSGKGVPAAFFMAISAHCAESSARSEIRRYLPCQANDALCAQTRWICSSPPYGILNTETGERPCQWRA